MDKKLFNILSKIENKGFQCYIVGGYVRDYVIGKESSDIDLATNATPKDILNIFKDCKTKSYEYGSVHLTISTKNIEVTTFRKDITYKDKRKPTKIKYVKTIDEDVTRRDFTINTLYMDKNKKIIDPLDATKDIKKKIIKTVGEPNAKLNEDCLRILRAVRFATTLNFKLDNELKQAIINNKQSLKELSYDRKKEELFKIFTSSNKKYGIKLLKELDLIEILELKEINYALRTKDIMGIYAMCYSDAYPFTKPEKDIIKSIKELMPLELNNKVLYKYGSYPVSIVCDLRKLYKNMYLRKYTKLPIKDRKEIKITGNEICELMSLKPGFILKDIYLDLENEILSNRLKNDNKKIKEYLEKNYDIIQN